MIGSGDSPRAAVRVTLEAKTKSQATGAGGEDASRTQYGTLRLNALRHAGTSAHADRVSVPVEAWAERLSGARATPEAAVPPRGR